MLAGRNAHRAFVSAAALLGFDVEWLWPASGASYHSCTVTAGDVAAALDRLGGRCRAVYLTSPDYLGHMPDIAGIAEVCHSRGALLLVDGAHGAYLRFLRPSRHPMDLGADLCCDSAHKTLPALTGAAYLHVRPGLGIDARRVKAALALFGSSSPSWLVLQSLDACNPYLEALPDRLAAFLPELDGAEGKVDSPRLRPDRGRAHEADGLREGIRLYRRRAGGGAGGERHISRISRPGLPDPDADARQFGRRPAQGGGGPAVRPPSRAPSKLRAALPRPRARPVHPRGGLRPPPDDARGGLRGPHAGRLRPVLSPCVPIAVCGERIDGDMIERLRYYGIEACEVVE